MPRIQSTWYPWRVLWNVLWVVGWIAGLWGAGLYVRAGNFALALLLLLLSLGLLWCRSGISTISALTRFCFNPSTSVTKVANPLTLGCSLLGYDLFLSLIGAFFVALPIGKHLGATSIASIVQSRPGSCFYSLPWPKNSSGCSLLDTLKSTLRSRVCSLHCLWSVGCY